MTADTFDRVVVLAITVVVVCEELTYAVTVAVNTLVLYTVVIIVGATVTVNMVALAVTDVVFIPSVADDTPVVIVPVIVLELTVWVCTVAVVVLVVFPTWEWEMLTKEMSKVRRNKNEKLWYIMLLSVCKMQWKYIKYVDMKTDCEQYNKCVEFKANGKKIMHLISVII